MILVTPLVKKVGLKGTYRQFDTILSKASERPAIDLLEVSPMAPDARFYKSLRREFRRVRDKVITRRSFGDHFVEEGFIYFVK